MQSKTSLGLVLIYIYCSSFLISADSTSTAVDTSSIKSETLIVEIENASEESDTPNSIFRIEHLFSLLIIWLMYLTWKNAKKSSIVQEKLVEVQEMNVKVQTQMADMHKDNVEIQKQIAIIQKTNVEIQKNIANIQEVSVKVAVIPEMLKIINVLDDINNIQLNKWEDQLEKNRINFAKLGQLTFYLNESDGLEQSIIDLNTMVWDLTGKMSEVHSLMLKSGIEPSENEQRQALHKEMNEMLKNIRQFINELKRSIIKRFRLDIELKNE